jgi:glycerol-3-phosphate dehydrogenase
MTQATGSQTRQRGNYDVIIIGAGIVGSMIARELCRYGGRFALLEKEPFSGFGVSKANPCMLHSPLMFPSGQLRTKLAHYAAARYKKLARELDVAFKEVDEIFLAFDSSQLAKLKTAKTWADENHLSCGHEIIGSEKIRQIEPNASKKAIGALYGKGVSGGIYATEWTFALTENAVQNGLNLYFNSPVTDIKRKKAFNYEVITPSGRFKTRYIINAAGLFVDEIAKMVGGTGIQLILTKGTMLILDKSASNLLLPPIKVIPPSAVTSSKKYSIWAKSLFRQFLKKMSSRRLPVSGQKIIWRRVVIFISIIPNMHPVSFIRLSAPRV